MDQETLLKEIEELRKAQAELESKRYVDLSMAKFSTILRIQVNETLESWADRLLMELTPYVDGLQACLYSLKQNEWNGLKSVQQIGVYAFEKNNLIPEFEFGEGLVGQAAKSQRAMRLKTAVGQNQTLSRSGLSAIQPALTLILPLLNNDETQGVLELSLLRDLKPEEETFLNLLCEGMATNLMSLRSHEKMRILYEEAQEATNSLRAQEEELRQNMEEMAATQEEILRIKIEMEGQVGALNNAAIVSEADLLGNITYVNETFCKISKYNRDELLGNNHRMLKSGHQPDEIFDDLWATISKGKVWRGEVKNRAKDGSYYWISTTITPVLGVDGKPVKYIGVRFDITQQKEMELELVNSLEEITSTQAELLRRESELKGYINSINNTFATIEFKMNGEVSTANPIFLNVMGYTIDEIKGKHHSLFVDDTYATDEEYKVFWEKLNNGEAVEGEIQRKKKNGEMIWLSATYTPVLDAKGKPYKVIKLANDISERKRAEEEIRLKNILMAEQGKQLEEKVQELQAAEEEMRQMNDILEEQVQTRTIQLQEKVQELEAIEEEMRQINDNLEEIVENRTRELQTAMDDLKQAQQQLVQSEKMASLGQLVAGVAHEINTPIGAVKASATNMEDVLPDLVFDLPVFCCTLPKKLQNLFKDASKSILTNQTSLTTREERQVRKRMTAYFENEGIENAEEMAQKLVDAGLTDNFANWVELLKHDKGAQAVTLLYKVGLMKANIDNISLAAEKTKRTVFALKSYSYKEKSAEPKPVNLAENLKMILTLYENQLKYGVDLTMNLDEDLTALCNPDEMGQVWTNLLHNALQAVNYTGDIQIICKEWNNQACVEVIDNGTGIPPEIQPQIFEPFFTTKNRGEGTGLGLAICKEMIEKSGGTIEFETQPGRTCFRVCLPLSVAETAQTQKEYKPEYELQMA